MKRLLNASDGVITTFDTDESTGEAFINSYQDVEGIIDANKYNQNSGHDGYNRDRSMRHFAEVPMNIIMKWMQDDGMTSRQYFTMAKGEKEAYIQRKINDPNWAYLRAYWQNPANSRILHRKAP